MLDAVEHGHETFRISRGGRPVARIVPAEAASGLAAKDRRHEPDAEWARDLDRVRALLVTEERGWNG